MTIASPLLNQLNLVVRDMDASLAFHRRLGLDIPEHAVWRAAGGIHHVEVTMSNGVHLEFDSVALARRYNAGWREPGSGGSRSVIGFALATREAVDRLYTELTALGAVGRQPPHDAFWGARYAIVADPDCNDVGLMSPIDPARKSAPPAL